MSHKKRGAVERLYEFGGVKVPVLEIPVDHAPALILGKRGARAIMEHLDEIRVFVVNQEITQHAIEQMCEKDPDDESGE